ELETLFEDLDAFAKAFPDVPSDVADDNEEIKDWLMDRGTHGYLVKFATPVMRHLGDDATAFSWNSYYTHWVYAETMAEAIERGLKWVADRREVEMKNSKGG
ncbi:MAG: hypothetical protein K2W93_12485, partial [Burkholderiaceae bacterium]|nr:hypothetical protein [Burkholderiaceae bacterium]